MDGEARLLLASIDPRERWRGAPLGLRDRALVALSWAGLSAREISTLRGQDLAIEDGFLIVWLSRYGGPSRLRFRAGQQLEVVAYVQATRAWDSPRRLYGLAPASVRGALWRRQRALRRSQSLRRAR